MQNKTIVILSGIFLILASGLVNYAAAHTGINDSVETTARQDYVYSNINAPCSAVGWNATDPASNLMGDADGDGICDGWELPTGLLIDFIPNSTFIGNGAGHHFTYSYPCGQGADKDPQCPSRDKKDVYIELDWMKDPNNSHVPAAGVIDSVVNAWAAAPVANPNGQAGIRLHVQYGEWPASSDNSHKGDIKWHKDSLYTNWSSQSSPSLQGFYRMKQYTFGTVCERFADTTCPADTGTSLHKNTNYQNDLVRDPLTAKFQVFHYAMIINKRGEQASSSGYGEYLGNDHVWSLGSFNPVMGNADQQAAVFMHELGHNFNLQHGGLGNDTANKPNYFSVMNPMFQFKYPDGKDLCRPLDYSNQDMLPLNENSLAESAGVNNAAGTGYLYPPAPWSCTKTWSGNAAGASLADQTTPVDVANTQRFFWYSTPGSTTLNAFDRANQPANWNNDVPADDSDAALSQSINADTKKQTLNAVNDWTNLAFDFGDSSYSKTSAAAETKDLDAYLYSTSDNCGDPRDQLAEGEDLQPGPVGDTPYSSGCNEVTSDYNLPPPLQQTSAGIVSNEVRCNVGLELIFKLQTTAPACVTSDTAKALIASDWGQE